MRCLICYDITAPRRLARMHRRLKRLAVPVQYSVFLADLTEAGLAAATHLIDETIDPRSDDVRIYPLPTNGWQVRLGRPVMPAGLTLTLLPQALRAGAGEAQPGQAGQGEAAEAGAGQALTVRACRVRGARAIEARARTGFQGGIRLIR